MNNDRSFQAKLARFTAEFLECRLAAMKSGIGIKYHVPEDQYLDRGGFTDWYTAGLRPLRLRCDLAEGNAVVRTSILSEEELRGYRENTVGSRMGVLSSANKHGSEDAKYAIEGGSERLTLSEFLYWRDNTDLGELGWLAGDWSHGDEGQVFLISAEVPHLGQDLEVKPPNAFIKYVALPVYDWIMKRSSRRGRESRGE